MTHIFWIEKYRVNHFKKYEANTLKFELNLLVICIWYTLFNSINYLKIIIQVWENFLSNNVFTSFFPDVLGILCILCICI